MNSRPAHVDHMQEHTPRKKMKVSTTDSYGETVRHVHKNGEFDLGTISTIEVRNSAALCLASMRCNFVSICVSVCVLCYGFLVPCFTGSIISLSLLTVVWTTEPILAPESEASKVHSRLSECGKKPTCPGRQITAPVQIKKPLPAATGCVPLQWASVMFTYDCVPQPGFNCYCFFKSSALLNTFTASMRFIERNLFGIH